MSNKTNINMEKETKKALFDKVIESSKQAIDDAPKIKKEGSVFETLCKIDCTPYLQYKNGYPYLPWAPALGIVKRLYPETTYEVRRGHGDAPYLSDGKTCWVEVSVTIEGLTMTDIYPITNYANRPIPLAEVTMKEVNDSIKRSLTKCLAMHGLALYLYGNEGLPEEVLEGLLEQVAKAPTEEALNALYRNATANNDMLKNNRRLTEACKQRKSEILNTQSNGVE